MAWRYTVNIVPDLSETLISMFTITKMAMVWNFKCKPLPESIVKRRGPTPDTFLFGCVYTLLAPNFHQVSRLRMRAFSFTSIPSHVFMASCLSTGATSPFTIT